MSFLNRSVLQERAAAATVEKHPLLKECDVPPNVKQAYLQGCVLAVLERDDGKVTDAARQGIVQLGRSLELAESEIDEAIDVVSGLTSTEDQSEFLMELTATLSPGVYPRFFMADFEQLIKKNESLSADAAQTVDYIGRSLTQEKSWRNALRARKTTDNDVASKGVSTLGRPRKGDDGEGKKRTAQPSGVDSYARLLEVVATHLNRSPGKITPGTVLIDDLDGIETAQLMRTIECEFGIRIPQSDFARLRTVECACQYLGCSCPSSDREGNGKGTNATSRQRKLMRERGMIQGKDGVYERLLRVVALQLNFSPVKVKPGTVLIENLDGIETVQLMQAIEYEFGICIPQSDFPKLRTMECACQYLGGDCPMADKNGNVNGPNVQSQQRSCRVPQRGAVEGFWQENGDSIKNGLKVAGSLLLRRLLGG